MTNGDAWQAVNENFGDLFRRVNELEARATPSPTAEVISLYMSLPGLRGFWPMSSIDYAAANRAVDVSGQANHMTANNVPLFGYDGLAPYVKFDGVDQYLSKADGGAANWADIRGNESYIVSGQRGLSIGGWFFFDSLQSATSSIVISKTDAIPNRCYSIQARSAINGGFARFRISSDGTAQSQADSIEPVTIGKWNFMAGVFVPSTSVKTFLDSNSQTNALAIPATIVDSVNNFTIGSNSVGASLFNGRASMCFLCAASLSDDIVNQLYQQSRGLFRV